MFHREIRSFRILQPCYRVALMREGFLRNDTQGMAKNKICLSVRALRSKKTHANKRMSLTLTSEELAGRNWKLLHTLWYPFQGSAVELC